ncbi:hypothetical protein MUK42_18083 [Musa troglodytarum]|nr:hypothetical protein MUK42_18083 [Musa troglodytarum]
MRRCGLFDMGISPEIFLRVFELYTGDLRWSGKDLQTEASSTTTRNDYILQRWTRDDHILHIDRMNANHQAWLNSWFASCSNRSPVEHSETDFHYVRATGRQPAIPTAVKKLDLGRLEADERKKNRIR